MCACVRVRVYAYAYVRVGVCSNERARVETRVKMFKCVLECFSRWHSFRDRYRTRLPPGCCLAAVQEALLNDRNSGHPRALRP